MKLKHVFTSLGLATVMALGVGTALAHRQKAMTPAKADADTWMINFSLGVGALNGNFDEDSLYLHTYTDGVGNDKYFQMYRIRSEANYFQVNATFSDSYTFDRVQFKYTENDGAVTRWATPFSYGTSKAEHFVCVYCNANTSGDDWSFTCNSYDGLYAKYNGDTYNFEEDPANARFVAKDVVSDESEYFTILYRVSWDFCNTILTDSSRSHFTTISTSWASMKAGTYDLILKNDNSDNGVLEVKKQETHSSYFYYVTQSNQACEDRLYTYGYNEAFGSWNATKMVKDITGVEEYFGSSDDFKFNYEDGKTGPRRVYKIPLTVGYPADDKMIMCNNDRSQQTSDLDILTETAFMWDNGETSTNINVARALEFVLEAEELRASYGGSVCTLADTDEGVLDAKALYQKYDALIAPQKAIVDRCEVYTWKEDKSGEMGDVSYAHVMERIGIIGGLVTPESNMLNISTTSTNYALTIVVISTIAIISAVGTFFIIRRRKHQ